MPSRASHAIVMCVYTCLLPKRVFLVYVFECPLREGSPSIRMEGGGGVTASFSLSPLLQDFSFSGEKVLLWFLPCRNPIRLRRVQMSIRTCVQQFLDEREGGNVRTAKGTVDGATKRCIARMIANLIRKFIKECLGNFKYFFTKPWPLDCDVRVLHRTKWETPVEGVEKDPKATRDHQRPVTCVFGFEIFRFKTCFPNLPPIDACTQLVPFLQINSGQRCGPDEIFQQTQRIV